MARDAAKIILVEKDLAVVNDGVIGVLAVVPVGTVLPFTVLGRLLQFSLLPASLLFAIAFLAVTYLFLVQAVKSWFYRRCALL